MLRLTLIRHAKSSWADESLDDFERPLNERGRRDAPRMAERVLRELGKPDRIVSSPALRALSTARIFAEQLGVNHDSLLILPRIYEASAQTLLQLVRSFADHEKHVMMFGHNPGFTELAQSLAACAFSEMPTCAVVQIEVDCARWSEISEHSGRMRYYAYPKQAS